MGGGGSGTPQGGEMGAYDPNFAYGAGSTGSAFNFKALGKGLESANFAPKPLGGGQINQALYRPGSGSPYVGGEQTGSADAPMSYQIQQPQFQSTDQQKIFYQLYQAFQQRLQNSGGQFSF